MRDELFERGDFEHILKEHADRFFLIPSERVWKSIYNDLHPGSKWPSLAAGLFMFLTLFWVGNTNKEYPNKKVAFPEKTIQGDPVNGADAPVVSINQHQVSQGDAQTARLPVFGQADRINSARVTTGRIFNVAKIISLQDYPGKEVIAPGALSAQPDDATSGARPEAIINNNATGRIADNGDSKNESSKNTVVGSNGDHATIIEQKTAGERSLTKFRNDFRKKLKWEYFIAPMISSVKFEGVTVSRSNSSVVYTPVSKSNMSITKRIGVTLGVNTYYPLSRRISLVGGTHFVYTGYNIYSEELRPNTTSLTLVDRNGRMFSKNYISYYGNDKYSSNANIINYNWELSVPVGMEWDVLPLRNVKISLVSTIEPFVVLGSKAYMLAGDASRYVTDPDLVRKFNLSGNLGSMVSFSGNTVNWKIGPNFRYQILSTYNNVYPVKEHFMSYGIHVGVSKK